MELEFHQLDVRYERLRVRQPAREWRLLASLADAGQQMPIVVVTGTSTYVVVDGHKRVRCLRQLHHDTVAAVVWEMPEAEALIFRQLLCTEHGRDRQRMLRLVRAASSFHPRHASHSTPIASICTHPLNRYDSIALPLKEHRVSEIPSPLNGANQSPSDNA